MTTESAHASEDRRSLRTATRRAGGPSCRQYGAAAVADLPEPVRQRGSNGPRRLALRPGGRPASLARFARFAPTKRARLAGAALGQAVQNDVAFRAMVAERAAKAAAMPPVTRRRRYGPRDGRAPARTCSGCRQRTTCWRPSPMRRSRGRPGAGRRARTRGCRVTAKLERVEAELRSRTAEPAGRPEPAPTPIDFAAGCGSRAPGSESCSNSSKQGRRRPRRTRGAAAERDRASAEAESWRQRAAASEARADAASQIVQRLRESAGDRRAASDRRLELLLGALEGALPGCAGNGI